MVRIPPSLSSRCQAPVGEQGMGFSVVNHKAGRFIVNKNSNIMLKNIWFAEYIIVSKYRILSGTHWERHYRSPMESQKKMWNDHNERFQAVVLKGNITSRDSFKRHKTAWRLWRLEQTIP